MWKVYHLLKDEIEKKKFSSQLAHKFLSFLLNFLTFILLVKTYKNPKSLCQTINEKFLGTYFQQVCFLIILTNTIK
jgi:hypothetical protein